MVISIMRILLVIVLILEKIQKIGQEQTKILKKGIKKNE